MTPFGTTQRGQDVHALTLSAHGLSATVLTYGAILQDVRLDGLDRGLTVGSDRFADYEADLQYHGAIVGPVANRISGGKVTIDGFEHQLERNLEGQHTLHSGTRGLHTRVWDVTDQRTDRIILSLSVPDGDFGLPGNRTFTATFEISAGPALTLSITSTTDAPTLINATNHSYWCLNGSGTMDGHSLKIDADTYLPTTADAFPTGDIAEVADTGFDFRQSRPLRLGQTPYDNTYPVAEARRALSDVLILATDDLEMTVATTETGVHIYDDRPAHRALAVECQAWPDAPSHRHFPSIALTPQVPVTQTTRWSFRRL